MVRETKAKAQKLLKAMGDASNVIASLSAHSVAVKTVTLVGSRPVIRVERCGYCDALIHEGRAAYLEFGCGVSGKYRQGQYLVGGCKVIWSESLH